MGIMYPSVTTVLSPYSGFLESTIPPHVLENAAIRGTTVHAFCSDKALGRWSPAPAEHIKGYVDSFNWWYDKFVDETLLAEEEIVDEKLGYLGHPDLFVRSEALGGLILIDNKTPIALNKIWASQLSAYKSLVTRNTIYGRVDRIGSLRLSSTGKPPKFEDYSDKDQSYFAAFLGALTAYRFFMEKY